MANISGCKADETMLAQNFEVDAVSIMHVIRLGCVHGEHLGLKGVESAAKQPTLCEINGHLPCIDSPCGGVIALVGLDSSHALEPLLRHDGEDTDNGDHRQGGAKDLCAALEPKESAH